MRVFTVVNLKNCNFYTQDLCLRLNTCIYVKISQIIKIPWKFPFLYMYIVHLHTRSRKILTKDITHGGWSAGTGLSAVLSL